MENEKLQEIAMMIIASAGESKGLSFNAIEEAKKVILPKQRKL